DVVVTITGTNDAPVVTFDGSTAAGFTITANDPDDGDVLTFKAPTFAAIQGAVNDGAATAINLVALGTQTQYDLVVTDGTADTAVLNADGDQVMVVVGTNLADTQAPVVGAGLYYGFDGNDTIVGGANNDTVYGGADNDSITGGTGADVMSGGAGTDEFVIGSGASGITLATADTIADFTTGADTINVAVAVTYMEVDGTANNEAAFLANAAVAFGGGTTVYVEYNANGTGNTWVLIDQNGDGVIDANDTFVVLTGVGGAAGVDGADFI
ncbi:calcium-binding protein, partial [Inhella sp. 4Y17]|nr:calcium-binding protein [Inhella gelatinilytica]